MSDVSEVGRPGGRTWLDVILCNRLSVDCNNEVQTLATQVLLVPFELLRVWDTGENQVDILIKDSYSKYKGFYTTCSLIAKSRHERS
jgi:hypothetical protein